MKKLFLIIKKEKPYLYKSKDTTYPAYPIGYHTSNDLKLKLKKTSELAKLNGKIVVECDFKVDEIKGYGANYYYVSGCSWTELECGLGNFDAEGYLNKYLKGKNGYTIHINNLRVFDEPKEKEDLWSFNKYGLPYKPNVLKNGMKVEFSAFARLHSGILLFVSSQEACNILNRKQTILIRKKISKEMRSCLN